MEMGGGVVWSSCDKMIYKISLRQRIQLYINFSYVCVNKLIDEDDNSCHHTGHYEIS